MSSDDTTAQTTTGPVNLAEASRRILEEGFNQGNVELADQLISPQAINHDPAEPAKLRALRGPEVFKRTVMMYRAAFPDVQISVDDVIAADDKVVLRWHSEGTHRWRGTHASESGASPRPAPEDQSLASASTSGMTARSSSPGPSGTTLASPASSAQRHQRAASARRSEQCCSASWPGACAKRIRPSDKPPLSGNSSGP